MKLEKKQRSVLSYEYIIAYLASTQFRFQMWVRFVQRIILVEEEFKFQNTFRLLWCNIDYFYFEKYLFYRYKFFCFVFSVNLVDSRKTFLNLVHGRAIRGRIAKFQFYYQLPDLELQYCGGGSLAQRFYSNFHILC